MSPARPPAADTPAGRSSTLPEVRCSERGVWSNVGIQKPSARSSARPSGHQKPPAAAPPCPRSAGATSPKPLQAYDRPPPPPLHARPVSCSDRAHIRAREACSAQRPWRMMQNTSRCRRVIGRRHHLRSTPAPLRPLAAAPPCPKSPRAREVCGGSKLEAASKRQKFWTEASICTSSLWIEFAFGFCTMTLLHFS